MLALHHKINKCLENKPLTNHELFKLMPEEKPVSIRAVITQHPELFVRLASGVIGRRGRDDCLSNFYGLSEIPSVEKIIKYSLSLKPKTWEELYLEFPDIKEESIRRIVEESENVHNKNK